MKSLLAGFALLLASSAVMAADGSGAWYVGVGGGQTTFRETCSAANSAGLLGTCDDEGVGWKVLVGRNMSKYFGVELSYTDTGEADIVAPSSTPGTLTVNPRLVTLWGKLEFPLGTRFSVLAKAGLTYFKVDYQPTGSFTYLNTYEDGLEPSVGAGASFNMLKNLALRAEWEQFNDAAGFGNGNVELVSASVLYKF